jgi:hypothetical protein
LQSRVASEIFASFGHCDSARSVVTATLWTARARLCMHAIHTLQGCTLDSIVPTVCKDILWQKVFLSGSVQRKSDRSKNQTVDGLEIKTPRSLSRLTHNGQKMRDLGSKDTKTCVLSIPTLMLLIPSVNHILTLSSLTSRAGNVRSDLSRKKQKCTNLQRRALLTTLNASYRLKCGRESTEHL